MCDGARLVALCDLNRQRVERAEERVSGARIYTAAADLFATEDLDFVEICTLPDSHCELVDLAARTGYRDPLPEAGGHDPCRFLAHD